MFRQYKFFLICLALSLVSCGGGSSTSTPVVTFPPAQAKPLSILISEARSDFFSESTRSFLRSAVVANARAGSGPFLPSSNFDQMCPNPRSGHDRLGAPYRDILGTNLDEKNWIRSFSHEHYLWYNEITDVDPASVANKFDYFALIRSFARTRSGAEKDRFHFTIPTEEFLSSNAGISAGYGAEFAVLAGRPPRQIVVAYVEIGSPAAGAGVSLARGTEIIEVNDISVVNDNTVAGVATLNEGLFNPVLGRTYRFVVRDKDSQTNRNISMTAAEVNSNAVHTVETIEAEEGKLGYLLYNGFVRASEQPLINAFNQLKTAQVTDLVLDLRYNSGGALILASELAYMIAGRHAAGTAVFEGLSHNDKQRSRNSSLGFRTTAYGMSSYTGTQGESLPSLNLERLFVLTTSRTCSASESVINGLRGIDGFEVVLIGDTTCGKPYGFYAADNCGTSYFTIMVQGANAKGFGDYGEGFKPGNKAISLSAFINPAVNQFPFVSAPGVAVPGCFVVDDFTEDLGNKDEALLKAALQYRKDKTCPTIVRFASYQTDKPVDLVGKQLSIEKPLLQNKFLELEY